MICKSDEEIDDFLKINKMQIISNGASYNSNSYGEDQAVKKKFMKQDVYMDYRNPSVITNHI